MALGPSIGPCCFEVGPEVVEEFTASLPAIDGLVVQGPLTATLLLDLLCREIPGADVGTFRFRGLRPLLDTEPFQVQGRCDGSTVNLWALDASGTMAMDAQAELL